MNDDDGLKEEDGVKAEEDGLKEEDGSDVNVSPEMSKSVETEDEGSGAKRGFPDDETDVLESPLLDSPSDDQIEPIDTEGVSTDVSIEFISLTDGPLVSLPRSD